MGHGVLPLIDKISIPNAIFCRGPSTGTFMHFEQQDEWSCGYRNLQMMLSSILPNISENHPLFRNTATYVEIPTTLELQRLLEMSWKDGFDSEGAKHYRYKVRGTCAEIGAVEVGSLLSYLSIDSVIVQFEKSKRFSWDLAEKFIWHYFSKPCQCDYEFFDYGEEISVSSNVKRILASVHQNRPVFALDKSMSFSHLSDTDSFSSLGSTCHCFNSPLYLQWDGHSVTIVGIEKTIVKQKKEENNVARQIKYNLLVFDPAKEVRTLTAGLKIAMRLKRFSSNIIEPLRLPMDQIKGKRIQVILSSTRPLTVTERNKAKRTLNAITAKNP